MTRLTRISSFGVLILGGGLAGVPAVQARTCGGAGDIVGSFGWLATRTLPFVASAPAASTTTTSTTTDTTTATTTATTASTTTAPAAPIVGSPTTIGTLVAGALNGVPFTSVGHLYFDGSGNVLASSSPAVATNKVGTYTVNTDCTLAVTLTDAFSPASAAGVVTASAQPSSTFEGVAVLTGNQINLTQTGTVTGTSITLQKTKQSCSTSDVFSAYGIGVSGYLVGSSTSTTTNAGTTTTTTPNVPFSVLGRIVADGNGLFYEDNIGVSSPLVNREITGTYGVNADCTGAASLVTADGKKRAASFVVVATGASLANGQQALLIAFTDPGVFGYGLAQQQ